MRKRLMPVFGGTCLALSLIQPLAGHAVVAIKMDDPPKDIQLLPGYKHRRVPTMDTMRGVISKDAGPRIDYEIDANGQNRAAEYPQTAKSIFRTSVKTERMYADVVLDADADTLVVTMEHHANFTATGVKSRRDLTEALLMIMSYDAQKR